MPSVRDKLLLNGGGLAAGDCTVDGNADAIQEQFKAAGLIAAEIETHDFLWDPDVIGFRDKLVSICNTADHDQDAYIKSQDKTRKDVRQLADEMRKWLDDKLQNQKATP